MKPTATMLSFSIAGALALMGSAPARAQQTTGTPGSPGATTTIDGREIPNPPQPFQGEIDPNAVDSKPSWPPLVVPPKGAPNVLLHPPLALNLFYLLTPFAQLDPETGDANAHAVMGEAMRVLHENSIVPQSALEPPLTRSQIKISLHTAETEELSKVWTALEKDLRLSAIYEVSFVDILAKREQPLGPRLRRALRAGAAAADAAAGHSAER